MTYTPSSRRRSAMLCADSASPIIMGNMGCSPYGISKPSSDMPFLKYVVFDSSLSRNSVDCDNISKDVNDAPTILGAKVLENR